MNLLFKLSYLSSNFELTLGYLNPALNNSAQQSKEGRKDNTQTMRENAGTQVTIVFVRLFLGSDASSVWNFCTRFSGVIRDFQIQRRGR